MSRWNAKTVIGLTGNIGTGKSVIRQMLEHLGAFGIDADAISHRIIEKEAPGYALVVEFFGQEILKPDGEIDRGRLARIVFSDPEALQTLEGIIHPLVTTAIDQLIRGSERPVIVIEAIKLIEGSLGKHCDSIWVTYAAPGVQLERLVNRRKMSETDARQRIEAQPSQAFKMDHADVLIDNNGSIENAWKQVLAGWQKMFPDAILPPPTAPVTVEGREIGSGT